MIIHTHSRLKRPVQLGAQPRDRVVDLGEEVRCHADDVAPRGDEVDEAIARLRAEMREGA